MDTIAVGLGVLVAVALLIALALLLLTSRLYRKVEQGKALIVSRMRKVDVTFTGAVFTIRPVPSNAQDGSLTLKTLVQSPDFTLDWDPEADLLTQGQACSGEGCPPQAAVSGGGRAVAALR